MQDKLNEFRIALFGGESDHAERIALGCLAQLGESALWLNELGGLACSQGRFAEALQYYDRAVCADPWFVEALLNGAIVLSDLGFYDEAQARFAAAGELDSAEWNDACQSKPIVAKRATDGVSAARKVAEKHMDTAELYLGLGRLNEASEELTRASQICDSAAVHIALARVFLLKKECDTALAELECARTLEPRNGEVHVVAAQCYLLQEKSLEAREALARAELLRDRSNTGSVLRLVLQR